MIGLLDQARPGILIVVFEMHFASCFTHMKGKQRGIFDVQL